MGTPAFFKDALLSFEQRPLKPLLEKEIYNLIQKQIPEGYGELSTQKKAKLIAFRFLEPSKIKAQKTGFYFQPLSVTKNEDGTVSEFPPVSMIVLDTVNYWTSRLEQTQHPVLAARYAGLIYDLTFHVTNTKPPFAIAKKYIESLLELIEQKLYKVSLYAIGKAGRALEVALSMNNDDLIKRCKAVILKFEDEIAISDKPGLW